MRNGRCKIKFEFRGKMLEYEVNNYNVINHFLVLFIDDKKFYFNTDKLSYFEVIRKHSLVDAEDFWIKGC